MLNNWPLVILLLVLTSTLVPLALWWLSERSRWSPFFQSFAGVHATFVGVMSVLFSLNLVFICNEIWQNREAAKTAMLREAEALRNIGRIAYDIPNGGGMRILEVTREYLEVVCQFDFPKENSALKQTASPSTNYSTMPAMVKLSDVILDGHTLDKMHSALRPVLLSQLFAVRDKRLEIDALRNIEPNMVKWLSLIFLGVMAFATVFVIHISKGRALLVACFIFLAGVNPFLAVLYDSQSPFAGIYPLDDGPLEAAFELLKNLEATYRKK